MVKMTAGKLISMDNEKSILGGPDLAVSLQRQDYAATAGLQQPDYAIGLQQFLTTKKTLALLLDFDGTLSPLVSRPEDAVLPAATRQVLERLAALPQVFLAIISGRQVENVREKVNIRGITYAGSHGLDIIFPDSTRYEHPIPETIMDKARHLLVKVQNQCERDGATVEDKGAVFTFHYRNVARDKQDSLVAEVISIIESVGFKAGRAHAAIESKPPLYWDKGKACHLILEKMFTPDWCKSVGSVYVGDDVTDEDAMRALKGRGFSFKVTNNAASTHADAKLPSVDSVTGLLNWLEKNLTPA